MNLKVKSILLLSCLSMANAAFSAEKKPAKSSKSSSKKKPAKKKSVEKVEEAKDATSPGGEKSADDSASHKKWEVLVNAGMEPSPLFGIGATVGRFLKPGLAVEGFFTSASGKVEPVSISMMHIGARARKSVFGKIPYVAGGLGMTMATGKWFTYSENQADEYPSTATSNAIALNLSTGAMLQFGSFLVGLDVGIIYPAFKMGVKDTPPTEAYDTNDYSEQKAKFDSTAGGMGMVAKLGVGLAF